MLIYFFQKKNCFFLIIEIEWEFTFGAKSLVYIRLQMFFFYQQISIQILCFVNFSMFIYLFIFSINSFSKHLFDGRARADCPSQFNTDNFWIFSPLQRQPTLTKWKEIFTRKIRRMCNSFFFLLWFFFHSTFHNEWFSLRFTFVRLYYYMYRDDRIDEETVVYYRITLL